MNALELLDELRSAGWSVGVHNDYSMVTVKEGATVKDAVNMTFWLLTHKSGIYVRGEGPTDQEALMKCVEQMQMIQARFGKGPPT